MDSGNSGSIQSSSGADEEYDSRAADSSISAFLSPSPHIIGPRPDPPPSHQLHNASASVFDPVSSYFNPIPRSPPLLLPNSLVNLEPIWPTNLRSDQNCTDINPIFATHGQASSSSQPGTAGASSSGTLAGASDQNQNNQMAQVTRNPKKRSRASRRAPTTVLTTDTTNFRALVQEFTGVPAPPFTSSSPLIPRARLDLFGAPSSIRSHIPLDQYPQQPPYLLRPFAQKIHPTTPFLSPPLSNSALSATLLTSEATNNNISSSSSVNPAVSRLDLLSMQRNVDPIVTFQALLQSAVPKYPIPNSSILSSKSLENISNGSQFKMGSVLDEFGLTPGMTTTGATPAASALGDLPILVSDEGTARRTSDETYDFGGSKLNYSASASSFHGEKGPESVSAARGEGMVESWICSSD